METKSNWQTSFLITGAVIGALVGVSTAYLLVRTAEETNEGNPPRITTNEAIRTALGIIGAMRGIASLGGGKKK
jgi:hypothetical protein